MVKAVQDTAVVDLEFKQGDHVSYVVRLVDFSGEGEWKAQIRRANRPDASLVAEFDVTVSEDGSDTLVELELAADDNTLAGSFYWDLQVTDAGRPRTYLAGSVLITGEVTS